MPSLPRRRTTLLLAATSTVALTGVGAAPAQAAYSPECSSRGIGCLSFSGYAGTPTWGFGVNSTGNNCVNYAAYRLAKNGVRKPGNLGNGGDWASRARSFGIPVNSTPAAGSIAAWSYGSYYAPRSGHVGYVEEVTATGIVVSDSSWSGGSKRYRITKGDPNWPNAFIHFKDVGYTPPLPGQFVKARGTNATYRLVGKTPVYVSSWAQFGGVKPTVSAYTASIATLPATVPNGTFLEATSTREAYVVVGGAPLYVSTWATYGGVVKPRTVVDRYAIERAGSGGYYGRLNAYPAGTTYVRTVDKAGVLRVYQLRDGYAYYVRTWDQVGGQKPTYLIDHAVIENAGGTGRWSHLRGVRDL